MELAHDYLELATPAGETIKVLRKSHPRARRLRLTVTPGGARVTYAAQHLHGGIGVDVDYPVHRYYPWARQIGLHLGSGAEQLAKLGERLAS